MMRKVIPLFSLLIVSTATHWCGLGNIMGDGYDIENMYIQDGDVVHDDIMKFYEPEDTRVFYKPKDFPHSFNFSSGVFTSPEDGKYIVTLTATLAKNPGTDILNFAQLFIMKNGKLTALDQYLLVEQQKVANLNTEMELLQGDTISVYVGYHVKTKPTYQVNWDSFHLDVVRLCIFLKGDQP